MTDIVVETKDISSFLSGQSPMVTLPPSGARAEIFTPQGPNPEHRGAARNVTTRRQS